MIRKLCVRSLRRGTGSMDCIHSLLLMEDDLDEANASFNTEHALVPHEETPDPKPGSYYHGASVATVRSCHRKLKTNAVGKDV